MDFLVRSVKLQKFIDVAAVWRRLAREMCASGYMHLKMGWQTCVHNDQCSNCPSTNITEEKADDADTLLRDNRYIYFEVLTRNWLPVSGPHILLSEIRR